MFDRTGAKPVDRSCPGQGHQPGTWRPSRLIIRMGLTPHLRVNVQGDFFSSLAIIENLADESEYLGTGTIVKRGESRLITLGCQGNQLGQLSILSRFGRF